jgi:alpha-glucosidase
VSENAWWKEAVVYQIYPRSFQDSDGNGIGDLRGIEQRLDYLVDLGVDAFWLSPINESPNADWGYDVSDHRAIHPDFGTLDDFDSLVEAAHRRGVRVLLDLIPSHTSIEHPWFRERPDWYTWADEPPNNWLAAFGGRAWSLDKQTGRYYLHSFYPEQPDLDWRNPDVREAIADVVTYWRGRGVDGFRVDAVDRLSKDPELRDDPPRTAPGLLPLPDEYGSLLHLHSRNAPGIEDLLLSLREAAGDAFLVGEVYRPTGELQPYLAAFDLLFAFEFMHADWRAECFAEVLGPAWALGCMAWVLSNHDFTRLASRVGDENVKLAAALQLTLPGTAFVYQGDELGLHDGPGADPPFDRAGRDRARHPMQWDSTPGAGFSTGQAWLPPVDPERRSVSGQLGDSSSVLESYRELIRLRRSFGPGFELLGGSGDVLAFRRGRHEVRLNFGEAEQPLPAGDVLWASEPGDSLAPHGAVVAR